MFYLDTSTQLNLDGTTIRLIKHKLQVRRYQFRCPLARELKFPKFSLISPELNKNNDNKTNNCTDKLQNICSKQTLRVTAPEVSPRPCLLLWCSRNFPFNLWIPRTNIINRTTGITHVFSLPPIFNEVPHFQTKCCWFLMLSRSLGSKESHSVSAHGFINFFRGVMVKSFLCAQLLFVLNEHDQCKS